MILFVPFSVILSILALIVILGTAYDVIIVQWLRKIGSELEKHAEDEKIPMLNHNSKEIHMESESNFFNFISFEKISLKL